MNKLLRLKILDNLEVYTCEDSTYEFPQHFHEKFAISVITDGIYIENGKYATKGDIVVSYPFEIHHNTNLPHSRYSMITFYISEDVINSVQRHRNWECNIKIIKNPVLFSSLHQHGNYLIEVSNSGKKINLQKTETEQLNCLNYLTNEYSIITKENNRTENCLCLQIKQYIDNNLETNITLETMEKVFNFSKYKLIRVFKKVFGITPFHYIILNRILKAKGYISDGFAISDAALSAGFFDQSHFHKYFKRYFNVTPGAYQQSCNILQD